MNFVRILFLCFFCFSLLPAYATNNPPDPFLEVVKQYQNADPKPEFPELARKFKVQAEFALQEKRIDQAIDLYNKALLIVPWWPEGHYGLALALAENKRYREAMLEMKRFMLLAPSSPDTRAAQDKIYQWESVAEPEAGKTFKDCPACPEMVELPAGNFVMGSDIAEADEKPKHVVTISKPFAIGKTEVTQEQWQTIMGNNPSHFTECGDNCPVEQVSWDDVQKFITKLNEKTGKSYRLPTESEWEYACRAGKQQEYCGGDQVDSVSWHSGNSGKFFFSSTHPVATKQPNAFGLYDMSGNVWEWTADTYHENFSGAPADGTAWQGGTMRVLRGGSWGYAAKYSRASARSKFTSNYAYWSYGFRLARDLP